MLTLPSLSLTDIIFEGNEASHSLIWMDSYLGNVSYRFLPYLSEAQRAHSPPPFDARQTFNPSDELPPPSDSLLTL